MLKNKKIFISGGAGVIGTAIVEKLDKLGAKLFVCDLKPRPKNFLKNIMYRQGDLNFITKNEIEHFKPEYFFHLAATFERSEESIEFWNENYEHNLRLSHHLMNIFKEIKSIKKIIFASSYLIYEPELYTFKQKPHEIVHLKESDSIYPRNTCGAAKLFHEIELRFIQNFPQTEFDIVSARIFRVYGKNSKDIISRWVRTLLKNEEITLYNEENSFDYIYADDVAEGLIKLAEKKIKGIVNLGNGNSRKIEEVVDILKKHFPKMKTRIIESNVLYESSQAEMSKFKQATNWSPKNQLEQCIPKIIEFEKNRKNVLDNADFNILITSISKKIPLLRYVKRASEKLGNNGIVFGADSNNDCIGKHFVDKFWNIPSYEKISINEIISFCLKNKISCIIPTSDGELSFFSKHEPKLLKNKIHVMVSDSESTEKCLDKLKFYNELKNTDLNPIQLSNEINDINSKRIVVKERFSDFGIQKNGLNLSKKDAILYSKKLSSPVFQPFIDGTEFSIDVYVDKNGKTKGMIVRSRDLIFNGESQITTSLEHKQIEKICSKVVEKLNLTGHVVVQGILDLQKKFNILECNNRFGGASSLSIEMGLDTFYWYLLDMTDHDLSEYPFIRSKIEKKQILYPDNLILF